MGTMIAVILGFLFVALIIIGAVMYTAFAWGYVSSVIYGWFITSQWEMLPDITWWQFAGIIFMLQAILSRVTSVIKKEYIDQRMTTWNALMNPWLVLLSAWILKLIIY